MVVAASIFLVWLAGARMFAQWSGWLEGRRRFPGKRLLRGRWFLYRRLIFAGGFGSVPCNIIVADHGVGLASFTPLPFFAPIFFPWIEVESEVVSGRMILRTGSGLSFTISGFRMDAVQESISAARR